MAPVADMRSLAVQPTAVFPVSMRPRYDTSISTCRQSAPSNVSIRSSHVLEHLAYVDADRLPKPCLDSAKWLDLHTTCLATMSTAECKEFKLVRANDRLVMPGRLGVKGSMNGNFSHVAGLNGTPKNSWSCPTSTSGHICLILVDCVRMNISHQTVFLDAARFQPQNSNGFDHLWPLMESLSGKISGVTVNDEEALFWKYLLPTFAERCGLWEHKRTCEYQIEGRMPPPQQQKNLSFAAAALAKSQRPSSRPRLGSKPSPNMPSASLFQSSSPHRSAKTTWALSRPALARLHLTAPLPLPPKSTSWSQRPDVSNAGLPRLKAVNP